MLSVQIAWVAGSVQIKDENCNIWNSSSSSPTRKSPIKSVDSRQSLQRSCCLIEGPKMKLISKTKSFATIIWSIYATYCSGQMPQRQGKLMLTSLCFRTDEKTDTQPSILRLYLFQKFIYTKRIIISSSYKKLPDLEITFNQYKIEKLNRMTFCLSYNYQLFEFVIICSLNLIFSWEIPVW